MISTGRGIVAATAATAVAAAVLAFPLPSTAADEANQVYDPALYEAMDYRLIGPYRGGRVTAVEGVPGKPHTFFMGSTGGGVWKSDDAGESWENISDEAFEAGSIGEVAVAPSDPNVIYVGTGSAAPRGNVSPGVGVYKSTDGGKTWKHVGLDEAGQIGEIVIHPDNPDVAYVAALGHIFGANEQRGVFKTTDGGESWEKTLFLSAKTGAQDLAMNPDNPRVVYAGMWRAERKPWTMISGSEEGGVYKTTDAGANWDKLEGGLPEGVTGKVGVTVSPAKPDRVWALIEAEDGGVYRSDDAGKSWKRVNKHRKHRQRAFYYTYIDAHPTDPNTVFSMNTRLYKSIDGGKSFETIPVPHGDVHDIWINPNDPNIIVNSNDGGANVSVDGGQTWTTQRNQPTAEFYSVTVDNQFPYRVYGPQQDNSTISVPSVNPGGISQFQHWYSIGGCETGPIALDPDDPQIVYSGCYGGTIDRYNHENGRVRNLRLIPELQIGRAPKDLQYRFQWNAPIEMSPHDSSVIYHGSPYVHRSTDGGYTWDTISPDLSNPDQHRLDYAGEPITKDNTGVEVYNTTFAIQESPDEQGTIWVGTNDGLVHLTRDNGESWQDITPADMPAGGTVNRIELSPHEPGRAFIAVYRYREDDFRPYIFRTDDYGEDWELLTDGDNGIPADHFTRVVREDPERKGLLYAGTEFGLYVSFDDGEHWQSLQLNLPHTPVTDLKTHRNDLVVATQGRSFWILDDLSPLHQLDEDVAEAERHFFAPGVAYRTNLDGGPPGPSGYGASAEGHPELHGLIRYYFAEEPEKEVELTIRDAQGNELRTLTSEAPENANGAEDNAGGEDDEDKPKLPAEKGANSFVWNLRTAELDKPDDAVHWGYTGGRPAVPGTYELTLSVGDWRQTRELEVRKDPRWKDVSRADLVAQNELSEKIGETMNKVYDAVRDLRTLRERLDAGLARAEEAGAAEGITEQVDAAKKELTALEKRLLQIKNQSHQDPLNFPPKLAGRLTNLYSQVIFANGRPTEGMREHWDTLNGVWLELRADIRETVQGAVSDIADELEARDVPALGVPARWQADAEA